MHVDLFVIFCSINAVANFINAEGSSINWNGSFTKWNVIIIKYYGRLFRYITKIYKYQFTTLHNLLINISADEMNEIYWIIFLRINYHLVYFVNIFDV